MNVLLLKDVINIGLAGQIKKVSEGYARNFLFPKKLAVIAKPDDIERFQTAVKKADVDVAVLGSRVAALAQQIKSMHLTLKKRIHDDEKLYGSVNADEIVDLLKEKGIQINKKQIEFEKTIRSAGEHKFIIKLTSKVKPEVSLKVIGTKE